MKKAEVMQQITALTGWAPDRVTVGKVSSPRGRYYTQAGFEYAGNTGTYYQDASGDEWIDFDGGRVVTQVKGEIHLGEYSTDAV